LKSNDILRRIRYILDLDDKKMIEVFAHAEQKVARTQIIAWLKQDTDEGYLSCPDVVFASFLNGLINQRRGKKEGAQPEPESKLNNNAVLRKLKIAFDLPAEDMLALLASADFEFSKAELSALFRRPSHKHYRDCKDQVLRNFLKGLQIKYRGAN